MKSTDFSATTSSGLPEFLTEASELIQQQMFQSIPDREPKESLYNLMRDYPSRGGKKFRSALVLLSSEWFGGTIANALASAVAYELFQNFALIHDDIEDDSLIRRGKETLHRMHGIPLALNAGDTMLSLVYEVLLSNKQKLGYDLSFQIMEHFNMVARHTFEGQAMDIGWIVHDRFPSKAEYQEMITCKTGWYSGKGPCQCGAMIGGAADGDIELIGKFGEAIGIGFQARDDVLNLLTTSEQEAPNANAGGYGKERGGDIAEGKRTLIVIELFDRLSKGEADYLHQILLTPREKNSEEEIEWVIKHAKTSGALDAVIVYCEEYARIALDCLEALPNHPVRDLMKELVSYLVIDRNF
ncbi:MAG: polyprenyl synthetase family protein [SAR324 cluster bacterium]|nr:polyprenyl synthetase family protein [SAR324 cluster bacterium]